MPILTRRDICIVEKLQVKMCSSVTLSIERLSGRRANIYLEKKMTGRWEAFLAHPRGGKERLICELCLHYLANSGRRLSFFSPSLPLSWVM